MPPALSSRSFDRVGLFLFQALGAFYLKKRDRLAVILGITTMLLALAPQLCADRTDHFKGNDHWNAMRSAESRGRDSDADLKHADAWRSDNDWHNAKAMCSGNGDGTSNDNGNGNNGNGNNGNSNNGNGNSGGSGSSGNGGGNMGGSGTGTTTTAATPEPSSLVLLLSALLAAAAGAALKKVVA